MSLIRSRTKSDAATVLLSRIHGRRARVAVVGMGYVGLPLATVFADAGHAVTGYDVDAAKVASINKGTSYIADVPTAQIARLRDEGRLDATDDPSVIAECDVVCICVPTPLQKTREPDTRYIVEAARMVSQYLHAEMLVVLESTTYPGTTEEVILPVLQEGAPELQVGKDFFLCFSPERVDPGRSDWTTKNTPKVIGGITEACCDIGRSFYESAIDTVVPVSSADAAEMTKLLENTFRSVNIGLVNEILLICDRLGLDAWEIIDAAATKPFGFMKFTPGPGLGGHCIPIDPLYLSWKLRALDYNARFIELASEVNGSMPAYWVQKIQDTLNDAGKSVRDSKVLVIGVAYKKDVDDLRESPALEIIRQLDAKGADVRYFDPFVATMTCCGRDMACESDLFAALNAADCVVAATDHSPIDWRLVKETAASIVDTRSVIRAMQRGAIHKVA